MKPKVVTSRDCVRVEDTVIEYEVRRSSRRKKTVQITLDGNGVRVAAPFAMPDEKLRDVVRKKAPWIIAHKPEAPVLSPPKRFASGDVLPYLGRDVSLVVEPADVVSPVVRFDHGRFRIDSPRAIDENRSYELIRKAIVDWYRARAAERLPAETDRWRAKFGCHEQPRVLIGDQRSLWGSCSSDGTLRFNWRLMMLEPSLIECVVVHELAHLRVRNHSAMFWKLVGEVLPDIERRRKLLRETGRALPI